jgi:hypothetical protein
MYISKLETPTTCFVAEANFLVALMGSEYEITVFVSMWRGTHGMHYSLSYSDPTSANPCISTCTEDLVRLGSQVML